MKKSIKRKLKSELEKKSVIHQALETALEGGRNKKYSKNKRYSKKKRSIKKKRNSKKKISTGGKYNKNPNRWWNKNLLHSLLLLDPGFSNYGNLPKYTYNTSIDHLKPGDYFNNTQELKINNIHDNPYTERLIRKDRRPVVHKTKD